MRTRQVVAAELAACHTEQKGILDKGDALTLEDIQRADALETQIEALEAERAQFDAADAMRARSATRQTAMQTAVMPVPFQVGGQAPSTGLATIVGQPAQTPDLSYAEPLRHAVTSFFPSRHFSAEQKAYRFGQWLLATCGESRKAQRYCVENGIQLATVDKDNRVMRFDRSNLDQFAHVEAINTSGGYLVVPEFENDLIILREKFGKFRPNSKRVTMGSDTKSIPRRTGGLTAYFTGEAGAATESTMGWDRVTLTAKKPMVYSLYSTELDEDSIVDIGNELAGEMAYAFSQKEDDCGFNGDGSSPYGGITGVRTALLNLSGTIANIAGLVVATGTGYATTYGATVLSDFTAVKGKLPQYAAEAQGGCKWYCHKSYYHNTMERLALAAGGVPAAEVVAGAQSQTPDQARFLGYPVEFCQIFPSNPAVSQVVALFGNLGLASKFGDRRMTTIAVSEHVAFANDEIAIRGTERFDIVVHDIGNASATAALRVPGPIVGLITAAS